MDMYSMSNLCEYRCILMVLYSDYLNYSDRYIVNTRKLAKIYIHMALRVLQINP
jgi:hypothetical protein